MPGLLFDQQFGLLPNAPVYLCAILGFWTLLRRRLAVALPLLLIIVPYALAVAMYAMWWAGYSSPARFLVPITLPLAMPGLISAALFAFLFSFYELLVSLFLAGAKVQTLTVRIWNSLQLDVDPTIAAVSTFLIAVTVLALVANALIRRSNET